jgi:ABC-2 type transport system ATP-binding protein
MDSGQIIALDTPRELVRQHGKGLIRVEFESLVNDRMLQGLQRLGTVRRMSVASDEFQIQSAEPNIVLKKVLSRAGECCNAIRSMQLLEPTLETVFLNLTGRSISD